MDLNLQRWQGPGFRRILTAVSRYAVVITLIALGTEHSSYAASGIPYFSKVKLTRATGESVEGYSWGLGFFLGHSPLSGQRIERVDLSSARNQLRATFKVTRKDQPVSLTLSLDQWANVNVTVYSEFERFLTPKGKHFFWGRGVTTLVLLKDVKSIVTLETIGAGFPLYADPKPYQNLAEKHITVEACGMGCRKKVFSHNPKIRLEELRKIWNEFFICGASAKDIRVQTEMIRKYQLEVIHEPFCYE